MTDFRRLLGYLKPYLGSLILGALLLGVAGSLMAAIIAIIKPLTQHVLGAAPAPVASAGGGAGFDILEWLRGRLPLDGWLSKAGQARRLEVPLLIVVVFFVRSLFQYFGQYLTARSGARVIRDIRVDLHQTITYQSLRFFQTHPTGVIVSRILNDVGRLQKMSTEVLADLVRVTTMIPFLLVVVLLHDWRMSLFALVVLPLLVYPMLRLGRRLRRASSRSQESMADLTSVLTEAVSGAKVVQSFTMERFEIGRFRASLERMLRADLRAARAAAMAPAIMELVGAAAGAGLFYVAATRIAAQSTDAGSFLTVLTGLGLLYMSFRRLNQVNLEIQQALAAARRVFDMMDREREIRDLPDAIPLPPFQSTIRLEKVVFAYEDEKILDAVDLTLRKGEVVALVGPSGAGKTTLASLLPRFWDPSSGRVLLDERDIRRANIDSLRAQIGIVTQETVVFDDTVRNNIAYGRPEVPLERVVEAAVAAQAHEFILKLPQGYDTVLGERGTRLSMGQRQRVTIARALLKDPPILILDEATSALDAESETLVQRALEVLMQGRTTLVIAHRLATVRRASRILVLDRGRIIEQGTHEELLARAGAYARLYALQFQDSGP